MFCCVRQRNTFAIIAIAVSISEHHNTDLLILLLSKARPFTHFLRSPVASLFVMSKHFLPSTKDHVSQTVHSRRNEKLRCLSKFPGVVCAQSIWVYHAYDHGFACPSALLGWMTIPRSSLNPTHSSMQMSLEHVSMPLPSFLTQSRDIPLISFMSVYPPPSPPHPSL